MSNNYYFKSLEYTKSLYTLNAFIVNAKIHEATASETS
jgi:hypothetical protein